MSKKIFISHSSKDKDFARKLSDDFLQMGYEPWLDEWEIKVGECIVKKIETGITDADFVVIILSNHSVSSEWVSAEWKTKYWDEIDSTSTLVLPVLIEQCEIPALLKTKKYADFTKSYAVAFEALVSAIKTSKSNPIMSNNTSVLSTTEKNFDCYWHKGVQEYFSQSLHMVFIQYKSESILFKESVLDDLEGSKIQNYMIFELFSEWDILIRFWSTEKAANTFTRKVRGNKDIRKIEPILIEKLEHFYDDGENYPSSNAIKNCIDKIGILPLLDLQKNESKSEYYDMAISKQLILNDKISFNPDKIQFYIVIISIEQLPDIATQVIREQTMQHTNINRKTIYLSVSNTIKVIVKGQVDHFYEISDFLSNVTAALQQDDFSVTTKTILIANRNTKKKNIFNFKQAEEDIVEKTFQALEDDIGIPITIDVSEKYRLKSHLHKAIDVIMLDDQKIIENILKALMAKDSVYIRNIKDFFPHFETEMRDNLPIIIRKEYGDNWKEILDVIKESEGINKNSKANRLAIGELSKIYKNITAEKRLIDYSPLNQEEFNKIMDELPEYRNVLAHTSASLDGLENLLEFCCSFLPIRNQYLDYFQVLAK